MQLSIIIVSYNVRALLAQCITSIEQAGKNLQYEIIVVDNNSQDDTADYFSSEKNKITFIWNKENLGFAKANNLGLSIAEGDYILFLNPDTIITVVSLHQSLLHIGSTTLCGAVGVQMIDGAGNYLPESKRNIPTVLSSLFYFSRLSKLFNKSSFFNAYHAGDLQSNLRHSLPILSGAFMMVNAAIAREVGGFDSRYFMYAEDVDLSMSIEKLGYKNWYLGDVKILHYKGESSRVKNLAYYKGFFGAMKLFIKKYNNKFLAAIKCFFINAVYVLQILKSKLISGKKSNSNTLPYSSAMAYCTEQERVALESWNKKERFAKKIIFAKVGAEILQDTDVLIYSSSVTSYSDIVKAIANSSNKRANYILNKNTLIGSNGKDAVAEIFEL